MRQKRPLCRNIRRCISFTFSEKIYGFVNASAHLVHKLGVFVPFKGDVCESVDEVEDLGALGWSKVTHLKNGFRRGDEGDPDPGKLHRW